MNLFLYHFIHLYFLTMFEIIFYIFYIMPYEKELILNLFQIENIPQYNISFIGYTGNCQKYQDRLDRSNNKLWNMCVYYLVAINAILFLIVMKDILQNVVKYNEVSIPSPTQSSSLMSFGSTQNFMEQKKNDDSGIEMIPKKQTYKEIREPYFVVYYWKKSVFIEEFCRTLQFVLLVAIFEYLFFKSVVNKYKILDKKTLLCELAKEI